VVSLPDSTKLATIGRIIRDVTNPEYLKQAAGQEFVFFFYVQEKPDEPIAQTMLGNLFLQSPDLEPHCLGLVIANAENNELISIYNGRGNYSSPERNKRYDKLGSIFSKPDKLKKM